MSETPTLPPVADTEPAPPLTPPPASGPPTIRTGEPVGPEWEGYLSELADVDARERVTRPDMPASLRPEALTETAPEDEP